MRGACLQRPAVALPPDCTCFLPSAFPFQGVPDRTNKQLFNFMVPSKSAWSNT